MLSTHGMMSCSGLMLVHGSAGQVSIPVGMEKSGHAPKPGGKSLTWGELESACTGNSLIGSALQETCGARWKKCRSCTFFCFFYRNQLQKVMGCWGI